MTIDRLLPKDTSFDRETVQAMQSAYDEVCELLGLSKQKDDGVTELVALKIIEIATAGEREAIRLREGALRSLGIKPDPQ